MKKLVKEYNTNEIREMILDSEFQTNETQWLVEMIYNLLDKIDTINVKYEIRKQRIQKYIEKCKAKKLQLKMDMFNLWKEVNVNGQIKKEINGIKKWKKSA